VHLLPSLLLGMKKFVITQLQAYLPLAGHWLIQVNIENGCKIVACASIFVTPVLCVVNAVGNIVLTV